MYADEKEISMEWIVLLISQDFIKVKPLPKFQAHAWILQKLHLTMPQSFQFKCN